MRVTHVHAHFANTPAAAALTIHRLTGLPFSFTAHGSDLHRDQHMLLQKVKEAEFAVCISEFNREWALTKSDWNLGEKVHVVHCGIDTTAFQPTEKPNRPTGESLQIVQVGTLHEVKGQSILLEACRILSDRGVQPECHFIGDGPDREMLEGLSDQLGVRSMVHFHGYCTPLEVRQSLSNADLLVCPSIESSDGRREGIPVVLMEAMASGVPVVASSLSGIPELVDDGVEGLLFRPGDSRELADAVEFIANSPEKSAQFASAGRLKILKEFDQSKNIDQLITLFEGAR